LKDLESIDIALTLNVPFACAKRADSDEVPDCPLSVKMYIDTADDCRLSTVKYVANRGELFCGVDFHNSEFEGDGDIKYITKNISIYASAGNSIHSLRFDKNFAIYLQLLRAYHSFMHFDFLETIRVSTLRKL